MIVLTTINSYSTNVEVPHLVVEATKVRFPNASTIIVTTVNDEEILLLANEIESVRIELNSSMLTYRAKTDLRVNVFCTY